MKKTDIHTFIKKYNSELSIKGYSKMKKADLVRVVESTLKRSRQEIKDEWSSMKQGSFATKSGTKRYTNTAMKTGAKSSAKKEVAAKSGRSAARTNTAMKSGARAGPKMNAKLVVAPGAQMERMNRATSRIETKAKSGYYDMPFNKSAATRRKAIARDTALARRIRGR